MRFRVLCLVTAFGMAAAAWGQGSPAAPQSTTGQQPVGQTGGGYTLTVRSQIVVLDVVVNDKKGEPVKGLTGDDFTVYEDKVPQKVRSFEETAPGAPSGVESAPVNSTAELDKKEPDAPVSIIVLDELTSRFEDEAFARYSLKKYLNSQGDTLQQPTMLIATNFRNLMVLRDYTTSKKEILEALEKHLEVYPWQAVNGSWKAEQFSAAFASLMEVAQATQGHPGHKSVIWVGRGFPAIDWTSLDPIATARLQELIAKCTNMLRDARVTLYAVDPVGMSVEPPPQDENGFQIGDPFGGQVDFDGMARETGGQTFHGRNDVDNLIGSGVRDGETFYTLSYQPGAVSEDPKAFRRIHVVMKNPNLTATTREGYYAVTPPPAPAMDAAGKPSEQLIYDLAIAGESLMVYDGVPLTIARDTKKENSFVLKFPASTLGWTPEPERLTSQVAVEGLSFDRKGKFLKREVELLTVAVPKLPEGKTETRTVAITVPALADSTVARVRFVLRSTGSGKVGADNFFLVDRKTLADPVTGLKAEKAGR